MTTDAITEGNQGGSEIFRCGGCGGVLFSAVIGLPGGVYLICESCSQGHTEPSGLATLTADAVHRIDHRTADMDRRLRALEEDWAAFKPVAQGFQRGGMLGARAAARAARRSDAVPQVG